MSFKGSKLSWTPQRQKPHNPRLYPINSLRTKEWPTEQTSQEHILSQKWKAVTSLPSPALHAQKDVNIIACFSSKESHPSSLISIVSQSTSPLNRRSWDCDKSWKTHNLQGYNNCLTKKITHYPRITTNAQLLLVVLEYLGSHNSHVARTRHTFFSKTGLISEFMH